MIFSFLCWTVVPTARLPPALRALSGCLSIDSWLLPLKFNCSFSPLQLLSSCSQETWLTQLHAYPEKRCRIDVFASSPWNPSLVRRERVWNLHWKPWEELQVTCYVCIVQQCDQLMVLEIFIFLLRKGLFVFVFWRMGSVSSSLIPDDCFWSKEGWWHWHIAPGKDPWVREGLLDLRLKNLALSSRPGTIKDVQTPSPLQASQATLGCCRSPSLRLSLTLLSHSVIMSAALARPFTRGCRKRRMCQGRLFGWERAGSCLLGRRRTPRRSE